MRFLVGENISESETRKRNRILNFTPFRSVPFKDAISAPFSSKDIRYMYE